MPFNPDRDIPALSGKAIFVTGGTAGLGQGSITELAKHHPAHIFFSGRNQQNADALVEKVRITSPDVPITFLPCDISSLASVKSTAEALKSCTIRLDILMLNAGVMALPPGLSKDGYEIQFATNYLGHALLVKLLLPLLTSTAEQNHDVRIINMTSVAYTQAPKSGIDFPTLRTSQPYLGGLIPGGKWSRYGASKLAQLLYTQEFAARYPDLTAVSVHPGIVYTGLFSNLDFATRLPVMLGLAPGKKLPVEEGHWNQCWAATAGKKGVKSGEYYEPIGVVGKRRTAASRDQELGRKLWEWTEKELEGW